MRLGGVRDGDAGLEGLELAAQDGGHDARRLPLVVDGAVPIICTAA